MFTFYIKELKDRLIFSIYSFIFNFIFSFFFLEELLYISIQPISKYHGFNLIFTELSNAFLSYLNLLLIFSFLLTLPFIIYNCITFITPSLYRYEFIFLIYFILSSLILLTFATIFINKIFLPLILQFFFKFELIEYPFSIFFEGRIDTYFIFIIKIFYLFNIIFQFPIILTILFLLNIINVKILTNYRKFFYFSFLILASILTPPDIISQILLVIPFILFFEVTIFLFILINNYMKLKKIKKIN